MQQKLHLPRFCQHNSELEVEGISGQFDPMYVLCDCNWPRIKMDRLSRCCGVQAAYFADPYVRREGFKRELYLHGGFKCDIYMRVHAVIAAYVVTT